MKSVMCVALFWTVYLAGLKPVFGQSKFSLSLSTAANYRYTNTHFSSTLITINGAMPVDVRIRQAGQVYSVGLMGRYALSNRLSVATGVWRNYSIYPLPTITTIPDLSANPNDTQIIGIASHKRNYQIPILVNYQSSTKSLSPYFSVGGLVTFPAITIFDDGSTSKAPNQTIYFYPTVGAGVIGQLSGKISLIVQPTFTYILPNGTFISYRNYQLGLQTQLLYMF